MKAYLKILVIASLLGIILAFIFFKNLKKDNLFAMANNETVFVFQVGVFKSYTNALNFKEKFSSAGIYQKGNYYHVILAVTIYNQQLLTNFFKEKQINYIVKEEKVNPKIYDKITKYDKFLSKTSNQEVIKEINKKTVTLFLEEKP